MFRMARYWYQGFPSPWNGHTVVITFKVHDHTTCADLHMIACGHKHTHIGRSVCLHTPAQTNSQKDFISPLLLVYNLIVCTCLCTYAHVLRLLKQLTGKMLFRRRKGTGCGMTSECVYLVYLGASTRVRVCVCVLVFLWVRVCPEDTLFN
jgi:hypothetical protein